MDKRTKWAIAAAIGVVGLVVILVVVLPSEEEAPPRTAGVSDTQRLQAVQNCLNAGTRASRTVKCVRTAMSGWTPGATTAPAPTTTAPPTTPPTTTAQTTTPAPTTATTTVQPTSCQGTQIAAGSNLTLVNDGQGKTYCLAPGTFNVGSTVTLDNGDVLVGAGRTQTFVKGVNGAQNLFSADSGATWEVRSMDISGAVGNVSCAPNCGRAFIGGGDKLTITDVRCHNNDNQCVGSGSADLYFINNECDHNGTGEFSTSSLFSSTRSASCIKRIRGGSTDIYTEVRDSNIHDNGWEGVWFDFYEGVAVLVNNHIENNGKAGIGWEVSGGWNAKDNLLVRGNVIKGNGHASYANVAAGMVCNTCAQALVENNQFGNNGSDGAIAFIVSAREWGRIYEFVVRNNTLNGDSLKCTTTGVSCSGNV